MPKMMFVACRTPEVARYWQYCAVSHKDHKVFYWGCEVVIYYYPNDAVIDVVKANSTRAYRNAMKRNNRSLSLQDELKDMIAKDGFKAAMMLDWPVYQIDENGKIHGKPFPLGNLLKTKDGGA